MEKLQHVLKVAPKYSGSFYVQSHVRVLEKVNLWKKHLPTVQAYYAVKCNPDPQLLEWLYKEQVGFDCASMDEISKIKFPAPIVYANPCKPPLDIHYANDNNISLTVVDSKEEIQKLLTWGWKGDALLRIRVDDSSSELPFSSKFGSELSDIPSLAKFAKSKSLRLRGISFHVGSGSKNPEQYYNAIKNSWLCLRTLLLEGHLPPWGESQIIDIGGGFTSENFLSSSEQIQTALQEFKNFKCIAEPGRFFAYSTQDLFTQVIGKNGNSYTIDESLYGQFSCIPFDRATPKWLRIPTDSKKRKKIPLTLFGRTCDSVDMIAKTEEAEELEVGDWLWWPNMGAYTNVTATQFNGFPLPEKIISSSLPDPILKEFNSWPKNISYVSHVKSPLC